MSLQTCLRLPRAASIMLLLSLQLPVAAAESQRLRVALVAGPESPSYQAAASLALLKEHLERNYAMECFLIVSEEGSNAFPGLEQLSEADTAVFFVRRKTLAERDLRLVRDFVNSGKGFVALRSTSHAWENWPEFDREVLGADYQGRFADGASMEVINLLPHPIFTGAKRFETDQYLYQYEDLAPDLQVLMEGTLGESVAPMAWTRHYQGGRLFHLVPGGIELFRDPDYLRIVANGILWVKDRPIPGAVTLVQRTYMADAYPGAFAVTFPQGPGLCYDPVRGSINYIWDGEFVDLRPRWLTKRGEPARIFGEIFYKEEVPEAERTSGAVPDPTYQFEGFRMVEGFPEFRYRRNGRGVWERLQPAANGVGVERRFRVEAGAQPLVLPAPAQSEAEMEVVGAVRRNGSIRFESSQAGEFIVRVLKKEIAQ